MNQVMNGKLLLAIFFICSVSNIYAQKKGDVLYSKCKTDLYDCCRLNSVAGHLDAANKVVVLSDHCVANSLNWEMVEIITLDGNEKRGWIRVDYLTVEENPQRNPAKEKANQDSIAKAQRDAGCPDPNEPFSVFYITIFHTNAEFSGIQVVFGNCQQKTIKSISFTVIPYDINNTVVFDKQGKSYQNCLLTTPVIKYSTTDYQNYNLFNSGEISYYKLRNIKVIYIDNSTDSFNYEDIVNIENF